MAATGDERQQAATGDAAGCCRSSRLEPCVVGPCTSTPSAQRLYVCAAHFVSRRLCTYRAMRRSDNLLLNGALEIASGDMASMTANVRERLRSFTVFHCLSLSPALVSGDNRNVRPDIGSQS